MQNLEMKALYPDYARAVERAKALDIPQQWTKIQTDTYYLVPDGKLKLRQVDNEPAELIAYNRPAVAAARMSDYKLFDTNRATELDALLSHVLPVDLIVQKERTLFLWENVRIHLDRVEQLGTFIEFEAVISDSMDANASQQNLDFLMQHFEIKPMHLVDVGYYELLKRDQLGNA